MIMRIFLVLGVALALTAPARAAVEIQEVTSDGGIEAWLVEENSIPFVALEIRFLGGSSLDEAGKRGATYLMTGLIEEGAGALDSRAFAEARDDLAASYSFEVFDDSLSVSARFLNENREEAVALLKLALTEPRFDQAAIDRVRGQVLSGLRSDLTDPNTIAGNAFAALAYGDHPYATDNNGTIESVTALTRDDIVAAHRNVVRRDNVYVGASGDISAGELAALLDTLFGDLPETGPAAPGEATVELEGGVTVIDFETPQSVAFFGHEGLPREDPDFFAAFVANEIFGGSGRLSRLGEEVREKRGLTYGVGSYLVNYDDADMLLGQFASANDRVGEAIEIVKEEWGKIAEAGVTEEELAEIKTYLTGAYPLRFDGNGPIARIMVGMQTLGLSPDYIETRNDRVNAVTLEDVQRVAARIWDPDALRFVVVGQPDGLESTD